MKNESKHLKLSVKQTLEINMGLQLVASAERYDEKNCNMLSPDAGFNVGMLKRDIKPIIEEEEEQRKKIAKKYEPYVDEKQEWKEGTDLQKEKFAEEIKKMRSVEKVFMCTVLDRDIFKDFKMSFQVYDLLFPIFKENIEEKK
jgi:hypothetical protein